MEDKVWEDLPDMKPLDLTEEEKNDSISILKKMAGLDKPVEQRRADNRIENVKMEERYASERRLKEHDYQRRAKFAELLNRESLLRDITKEYLAERLRIYHEILDEAQRKWLDKDRQHHMTCLHEPEKLVVEEGWMSLHEEYWEDLKEIEYRCTGCNECMSEYVYGGKRYFLAYKDTVELDRIEQEVSRSLPGDMYDELHPEPDYD